MSLGNLLQGINFMDLNLELARLKHLKQLINVEFELLASLDIRKELGTSNYNVLGRQFSVIVSIIL